MMWYEPFANPGEWALNKKNNITELVKNWNHCKCNAAVLTPFLSDGNYDNLMLLAYMYKKSGATKDQYRSLIKLCFGALNKCIDSHIEWKYNKSVNDGTSGPIVFNEFYHKVLEMALAMDAEGAIVTDKIIHNYSDIDDELKKQFATALIHMYAITNDIYTDKEQDATVEFNYAQATIKEIINTINTKGTYTGCCCMDDATPFKSFACDVIRHDCHKYKSSNGCIFCAIFDMLVDYFEKSENYKRVSAVMPDVNKEVIDDIYNTLKNVTSTTDLANYSTTADMIMHSGYSKEDLCKVTKLCINNLNHYNGGVCLDKSCEEAIIKGIMEYKPANELSGIYDIDYELTTLEAITIGSLALEASDDFDDEEEDDYTSRRNRSSVAKPSNEDNSKFKYDEDGYRIKNKRDFDSDFRKFKSNAEKVGSSIDKVAATVKNFALGTSAERGTRKTLKTDSLTRILARLFATVAVFSVNKYLGILMIIVRLVTSGKVTERERVKIIAEIKREIEVIDDQLSSGSVESQEARSNLIRTKRNLQEAYSKIRMNKARYMTDDAKQAVQDIRNRNKQ